MSSQQAGQPDQPVTGDDLRRVGQVGDRIRSEFVALVEALPTDADSIAGMARWLGLRRPICQRLVTAIRRSRSGIDVARGIPGVRGLTQFVDAAAERGCDRALAASARAAVRAYAALVTDLGGSQRRFLALLEAHERGGAELVELPRSHEGNVRIRRSLFEGVRATTGRWCDAFVFLAVVSPSASSADEVAHTIVSGHTGLRAAPGAMPMTRMFRAGASGLDRSSRAPGDHRQISGESIEGETPNVVLREFSSDPLPHVTARRYGPTFMQFVDIPSPGGEGLDYFLADRVDGAPHPATESTHMINYGVIPDVPARTMIVAVHLHESLARACIASAGSYAISLRGTVATTVGPDGQAESRSPDERWFDRLPDPPTLEYLGLGMERSGVDAYPRMRELTEFMLMSAGATADEYVGYRCIVEYPIWGTETLLSFDFGSRPGRKTPDPSS